MHKVKIILAYSGKKLRFQFTFLDIPLCDSQNVSFSLVEDLSLAPFYNLKNWVLERLSNWTLVYLCALEPLSLISSLGLSSLKHAGKASYKQLSNIR